MLFLDVTNRCNMNCPICIANIPSMGFEFHPPLAYFGHVLAGLAQLDPKPTIQLFGGEPTVRDDLFEIIGLCHEHGLRVRIVTNGLRLADEDYCRRLCATKTPVLIAFDGRDPEIYRRFRKSPAALEKKLKALENLKKFSRRKNTLMVCVARKVNDRHMGDLLRLCHGYRDVVTALHLIPLAQTWEEGDFETDVATTTEDVEKIMAEAMPDERVDFIPAGLGSHLDRAMDFFGGVRLSFGGVHPNCESMTLFLADAERYHAVGHYLKRPFGELAEETVARARAIAPRLARLDTRRWPHRLRGRLLVFRKLLWPALRAVSFRKVLKGNRVLAALRILGGLALGRRPKDVLRKHTAVQSVLRMIILPFEEYYTIDGARLAHCTDGFAYEDPDTGEVKTCPVCSWSLYKTDILRKLAAKYAPEPAVAAAKECSRGPTR
jgi:pyruvate-formate lyase-activating enzyme